MVMSTLTPWLRLCLPGSSIIGILFSLFLLYLLEMSHQVWLTAEEMEIKLYFQHDLDRRPGVDPWVGDPFFLWRRERLPTPVFWPGEFHGLYSPWGRKESDTTEQLSLQLSLHCEDRPYVSLGIASPAWHYKTGHTNMPFREC